MTKVTQLLPPFDFAQAQRLPLSERINTCIHTLRLKHLAYNLDNLFDFPLIPRSGASTHELEMLEDELGIKLPLEYRYLLSQYRYVSNGTGICIYGLDYKDTYVSGRPFVFPPLNVPGTFLAVGDYWRFANGDQLLIQLDDPQEPVLAYFHKQGPLLEFYAPSFSIALWRLVHEEI